MNVQPFADRSQSQLAKNSTQNAPAGVLIFFRLRCLLFGSEQVSVNPSPKLADVVRPDGFVISGKTVLCFY